MEIRKTYESVGVMVLCFLLMGRFDMATVEVNKMKNWADDATLAQLVEAWAGFYSVP